MKNHIREVLISYLTSKDFRKRRGKAKVRLYYLSQKKLKEKACLKFFKDDYDDYIKLPQKERSIHFESEKKYQYTGCERKYYEICSDIKKISNKYKLPKYSLSTKEDEELITYLNNKNKNIKERE